MVPHLGEANIGKIGQSLSPKVSNKRAHDPNTSKSEYKRERRPLLLMERKEPIDFSSHFYFEASGDSEEADFDPTFACEMAKADGGDVDDALSCNYDGSGACNVAEFDGCDESCDEHDGGVEKKEDDGVFGMSYCEDDEMQEEQMKSYVSFESGQESLDEMEKNRLFWEACLAS
ncbi:hypothetical protein JHK85_004372 [Glycine max]|nr:hypothetical protein JHK85_004372 [Glycine max]